MASLAALMALTACNSASNGGKGGEMLLAVKPLKSKTGNSLPR